MSDLNLDLDYFDHPKTRRLIGLLGKGSEVLPIKLWCWCAKYHADNGWLAGYSAQEIESILGWWGEPGKMIDAMVKVGFLEADGSTGYYAHDFVTRNGHIAAFKERAKKGAEARWGALRRNAASNAQASDKHSPSLTNQPNQPDQPASPPGGAVAAQPGQDLEQVIYDRIGWKKRLSRLDWDKALALKSRHGPEVFFAACDRLHGGVTNVPAYLESILEPKGEGSNGSTYKRGNTRNRTLGPGDIQRSLDVAESLAHSRSEPTGEAEGGHEDHRPGGSGEASP